MTPSAHQGLQLRPQHHALLPMRVGSGDDGNRVAGAGVEGEVGHVGGYDFHRVLKGLAQVHDCCALPHVNGGFVRGVFVGLCEASTGDGQQVLANGAGARRLLVDAVTKGKPLFFGVKSGRTEPAAFLHAGPSNGFVNHDGAEMGLFHRRRVASAGCQSGVAIWGANV